ncbi:M56 family metallopeptidase [Gordonia jinhuaensis]|uniref:Peptidase M48 domain-containing protein n=1 Tax=Gordonia jinhuaensis TaxID=1517702 RepID=A0A916T6Z1_9ACTN|nr:M56 family metallopeptidase [Gordonia jinhuaensis]GGB32845.1 hypothetical protein GCM10011489_21230 [Gordonia jinhuaensis]
MIAAVFGAIALLLAGPVPALLARADWSLRAPRAAMTLWQSISIAAVLSAFSCGLAIASHLLVIGPDGRPTTSPFRQADRLGWPIWTVCFGVFFLTLLIGARLIFASIRVGVRTRARRALHRDLVDLLDHIDRRSGDGTLRARDVRMLDVREPIAYCLPGIRRRVVLSAGIVDRLNRDELTAVITHERAHLRARHDLILEAFIAVHEAFPRVIRSRSALDQVRLLVEILADDHAVRASSRRTVGRALVNCADAVAPQGAMGVGGPSTLTRVQRLSDNRSAHTAGACAYVCAVLILVVPTLAVAIPWLTELSRLAGSL